MANRKLTPKQEKFCQEYMIDLNATQAAIRAGYSEKTAEEQGSRLLRNVKVQNYISMLKNKASEKIEVTQQQVLQELKNWAYSDITETISLTPEEIKELPKEIRRLITKYKYVKRDHKNSKGDVIYTDHVVELHFVSKDKAIDMINRHIGFYEKDNTQKKPILQDMSEEEKQQRIKELLKKANADHR